MKSEHRHELETNWLAKRLAVYIDDLRPYLPTIFGAIIAAGVALFGFSYFSTASTTRESEAWNTYNQAVGGLIPNLDTLRESAEEFPDSPMQQWADITWADGQVWMAARAYVQNRQAAMDALNRAEGTYQSLLSESEDKRVASRAHFGLGRIYELRNDLDHAREEYLAVEGSFAPLAKHRAEELAKQNVKLTYDWLATAEPPRRTPPMGPGTPGQRPEFSADDLGIPSADQAPDAGAATATDDLFKGLGVPNLPAETEKRYGTEDDKAGAADEGAVPDPLAPQQPAGEAAP